VFQQRPGQPRHLGFRDESLERSDNLPKPDVLAEEIVEDLEAALEQFREIELDLSGESVKLKEP
jgi:hypothetical protein